MARIKLWLRFPISSFTYHGQIVLLLLEKQTKQQKNTRELEHWSCKLPTGCCCVLFLDFTGRIEPQEKKWKKNINIYITSTFEIVISKVNM